MMIGSETLFTRDFLVASLAFCEECWSIDSAGGGTSDEGIGSVATAFFGGRLGRVRGAGAGPCRRGFIANNGAEVCMSSVLNM